MTDHRAIRNEYGDTELRRQQLKTNPVEQFNDWIRYAKDEGLYDYTAMSLSTVATDGMPSSRIVLLKHFDDSGFCWYTDYRSEKGVNLETNPKACLLFYWNNLHRQVRISGTVEKLSANEAESYFNERPANSRFSAAASVQSHAVESRLALEESVLELQKKYPNGDVPKPEQWGGYRLVPERYEFWQGRDGRLHDRFQYKQNTSASWDIKRLNP